MDESSSMASFLQQVIELVNEFACLGEVIEDAILVEHVLTALPDSFEVIVYTLTHRQTIPTFAELTLILLQEDTRREMKGGRHSDGEAVLVKNTGRGSTMRRSDPRGEGGRNKTKKPVGMCY